MKRTSDSPLLSLFLAASGLWLQAAAHGDDQVLVKDGEGKTAPVRLSHKITLEERQAGISGTNVNRWMIEPSGTYKVFKFKVGTGTEDKPSDRVLHPVKTGTLDQEELKTLARVLEANKVTELPRELGADRPVDNHCYTIEFGNHRARCGGALTRRNNQVDANIRATMNAFIEEKERDHGEHQPGRSHTESWLRFGNIAQSIIDHTARDAH